MAEIRRFLTSFDLKAATADAASKATALAPRESSIPERLVVDLAHLGELATQLAEFTRNRKAGQLGLPRSLQDFVTTAAKVSAEQTS